MGAVGRTFVLFALLTGIFVLFSWAIGTGWRANALGRIGLSLWLAGR